MSDLSISSIINYNTQSTSNINSEKLSSKLQNVNGTGVSDEELMEVCNDFESYMVEQVLKNMEKTIMKDEEESSSSSYLDMFGDTMYQEYSKTIAEQTDLGIAQLLYESMKRE